MRGQVHNMKKFGQLVVKARYVILIISILLLIPAAFGYVNTRVNYDLLYYLPDGIDTMTGQDIMLNDFGSGAFGLVLVDGMDDENTAKLRAFDERDFAEKELQEIRKDYYIDIKNILSKVHYHEYEYMDKMGKKDLISMIEKEYELGALIGKNSTEVSLELSCYLIGIYDYFQEYSKAFDVMLVMAELSDYWVDLESATLNWANKENVL